MSNPAAENLARIIQSFESDMRSFPVVGGLVNGHGLTVVQAKRYANAKYDKAATICMLEVLAEVTINAVREGKASPAEVIDSLWGIYQKILETNPNLRIQA